MREEIEVLGEEINLLVRRLDQLQREPSRRDYGLTRFHNKLRTWNAPFRFYNLRGIVWAKKWDAWSD